MIDTAKFLCSLLSQIEGHHGEPINKSNIQEALREQNYEVVNGELVQLIETDVEEPKRPDNNLKLLKDHWYKSAIIIDELGIEKDDIFYCSQDGYLDKNGSHLLPSELSKWLRFFDEVPGKRFKTGDYIKRVDGHRPFRVTEVNDGGFYRVEDLETNKGYDISMSDENLWKLWKVFDAKPGDFLTMILGNKQKYVLVYRGIENDRLESYVHWATNVKVFPMGGVVGLICDQTTVMPATRTEQAEFVAELEKSGYVWDPVKTELRTVYLTKFKVGDEIRHKADREVQHIIEEIDTKYGSYRCTDGSVLEIKAADEKYSVLEYHERLSDLDLILEWFAHIEQLATDRKTQNGHVMIPQDTLDEIKVLAKNSQEYIKAHVAPEKIIFKQADVDKMVNRFKTEPLRSDGRVADIYRRGIDDALKELRLRYGQKRSSD